MLVATPSTTEFETRWKSSPDPREDWNLNQALGELGGVCGIHIAQIAVKYGIDLEEQLASILPTDDDSES